jgi:hypothetical protein
MSTAPDHERTDPATSHRTVATRAAYIQNGIDKGVRLLVGGASELPKKSARVLAGRSQAMRTIERRLRDTVNHRAHQTRGRVMFKIIGATIVYGLALLGLATYFESVHRDRDAS